MPPPSPEVRGAPYRRLDDPYLTAPPAGTMLVIVNTTPKGRLA
jgi:hypothetical protein